MATLEEVVKNILDAIPDSSTRFPGRVWTRPILPEDRTGVDGVAWASTPEAFDPLMPIQILRCVSIAQQNRTSSWTNWPDFYQDFVDCWYYGPDTPADRHIMSESMEIVRNELAARPIVYDSGYGKLSPANDRNPIRITGEFFHAVYAVERFVVHSFNR